CCVNQYHAACGVIIDFQEFLKFLESTALADSYVRIPHLSKSVNAFFYTFYDFLYNKGNLFLSASLKIKYRKIPASPIPAMIVHTLTIDSFSRRLPIHHWE